MNKPFREKLNSTVSNHSQLKYHLDSVLAADTLRSTVLNPKQRIDVATTAIVQSQMTENTHILQQIVCGVIHLAKQGIPFRGDVEKISSPTKSGKFFSIAKKLC